MIFTRYTFVQVSAYMFDFGTFLLALEYFDNVILANILSKGSAGILAFIIHRRFTFKIEGGNRKIQAQKYALVLGLNIPLSTVLLSGSTLIIISPVIAKLFSDIVILSLTFYLMKSFVFRLGKQDSL